MLRDTGNRLTNSHDTKSHDTKVRDTKPSLTKKRWAAASGVVAAGSGVVLGELLAGWVSPSLSPMTAVGGAVIDAVPPALKD